MIKEKISVELKLTRKARRKALGAVVVGINVYTFVGIHQRSDYVASVQFRRQIDIDFSTVLYCPSKKLKNQTSENREKLTVLKRLSIPNYRFM